MKVAVFGCGSIGRRHARNLRSLGHDVIGYEPDPAARKAAVEDVGPQLHPDLATVWRARPEAAFVCAPPQAHLSLAQAAVEQGAHVFIEKPLADSVEGTEALARAADDAGRVTMVGCNMRFHPGPAALKQLLAKGAAGEPIAARIHSGSYLPGWRPWQDYRLSYSASRAHGGATLECIHELDLALWFFGPAALAGAAVLPARTLGLDTDGLAEILLRHRSGVLSSVHINFLQRDYQRGCEVIGSEGTLAWDFHSGRVELRAASGLPIVLASAPVEWELNRMYVDEVEHFLDAVARGGPALNPVSEAAATLRLALEARAAGASR